MSHDADVDFVLAGASETELLEVLAGRSDRFLASESIAEIRRRPSPRLIAALIDVLTRRSRDTRERWTAAVALADQPGPERQKALLAALDDPEAEVVRRAAQGLGRIGDAHALERLQALEAYGSEPARRAVAFARVLLSYRLSRGTHRLAIPPASELLEVDETVPLRIEQPDRKALSNAFANLRMQTPGVAVNERPAMAAACLGDQLLVLLSEEVAQAQDDLPSLRRDLVVAVVLNRYSDGYHLYEYLLAHPAEQGMAIFGVRPSGRLVHFGTARIDPERAEFQIRALNTVLSPPITIEGSYSNGIVRLTRAEVNMRFGANQKRPTMLARPKRRGPEK